MGLNTLGRPQGRCRTRWLAVVTCALILPCLAPADSRTGSLNATISQDVVGTGGGAMTSGTLSLNGTVGQAAVGLSSNAAVTLGHGVYIAPQAGVCLGVGPSVVVNIGEMVCLSLPPGCPVSTSNPDYQWFRQDDPMALVDLPGVLSGVESDTLCLASADTSDSDVYVLLYTDAAEAPAQFSVELIVVSAVPLSGALVLTLCALLFALVSIPRLSRKQRASSR